MSYLVPFDGSDLSVAALECAVEFANAMGAEVIALTVLPTDDEEYARERGWLDEGEPFDPETIRSRVQSRVAEIAPSATFRWETTEDVSSVATSTTDVVRTIRTVADEVGAEIVFIGSENAGRVSTPVSSVGAPVTEDPRYDVHIVRHTDD
jgi:nucleotide-binding universal stress UspA family protein